MTEVIRESGNDHPPLGADFDGMTRADALRALLDKHKCPCAECSGQRAIERVRFIDRFKRLLTLTAYAGIIWTGPKLTPQQAADILRPHANHTVWSEGPRIVVIGASEPSVGPWKFPPPTPARRLDGTLLSQPPVVYGIRSHRK